MRSHFQPGHRARDPVRVPGFSMVKAGRIIFTPLPLASLKCKAPNRYRANPARARGRLRILLHWKQGFWKTNTRDCMATDELDGNDI